MGQGVDPVTGSLFRVVIAALALLIIHGWNALGALENHLVWTGMIISKPMDAG